MPRGIYLRKRKPAVERFWRKVKKLESGCWEWQGSLTNGYGCFRDSKRSILTHRFAYELLVRVIPDGLTIDHLCRNRACVNPDHLEVVTNRENVLRGIGITALHASVTHCPKGHPYDLFNTYYNPKGARLCRMCHKIYKRQYYQAKRQQ